MESDKIWRKRAEDEQSVRMAVEGLLELIREPLQDPAIVAKCHEILATHLQTLERFTRPIVITVNGIPLGVYKEALKHWRAAGLPFYLISELTDDE